MSFRIDAGAHGGTHLPLCTTGGCHWRGAPVRSRELALRQAAAHEAAAHPYTTSARTLLGRYVIQRDTPADR